MSSDPTGAPARARTRWRVLAMAIAGVVAGLVVGVTTSWLLAAAAGWATACVVYIAWVWLVIARLDPEQTREHATREDPGHRVTDALVLIASVVSLAAVVLILVVARSEHGVARAGVAVLAVASVALSWLLVHTLYTVRYARMYYTAPVGGVDFNQAEPPRYSDFAYLAFTLGMTFQVSDTNLRSSALRSVVIWHTLLSYVFGSVILASIVNLIAGLG